MRDLPNELFEVNTIIKAKIQRNYHVFLGQEKNYYSVPFRFATRDALVIYNSKTVEIHVDNQRVAIHKRLEPHVRKQYQTNENHMPANHKEWKEAQGYDSAYFIREGAKIGPATRWLMEEILVNRIHQTQAYNSCKGILYMRKTYSPERIEKAAQRCQNVNKASYYMIKRILSLNLDQEETAPTLFNVPSHDNIRGPGAYQ